MKLKIVPKGLLVACMLALMCLTGCTTKDDAGSQAPVEVAEEKNETLLGTVEIRELSYTYESDSHVIEEKLAPEDSNGGMLVGIEVVGDTQYYYACVESENEKYGMKKYDTLDTYISYIGEDETPRVSTTYRYIPFKKADLEEMLCSDVDVTLHIDEEEVITGSSVMVAGMEYIRNGYVYDAAELYARVEDTKLLYVARESTTLYLPEGTVIAN